MINHKENYYFMNILSDAHLCRKFMNNDPKKLLQILLTGAQISSVKDGLCIVIKLNDFRIFSAISY